MAAPLIDNVRKQFEDKLAEKDNDIADREIVLKEKEKILTEEKKKIDEQIAEQVLEQLKKDRAKIVEEENKKAKLAFATDLEQKSKEIGELQEALNSKSTNKKSEIENELGDLLFAVANLARFLDFDPETCLRKTNRKFEKRFRYMEAHIKQLKEASLEEMEKIWQESKKEEQ